MKISREFMAVLSICAILIAMAASAADFSLGIYGNANLDETINDQDIAYVQDVIQGIKPVSNLTDANHDGKIDKSDIDQIRQIINGTEKELIIYDDAGDVVTIQEPVATIIAASREYDEALRAIKAADLIVAVDRGVKNSSAYFPELSRLPSITGEYGKSPDYEAVLKLKPDVYLSGFSNYEEDKRSLFGISTIYLKLWTPEGFAERVAKLGFIFNKREEAGQYLKWHLDTIQTIKKKIATQSGKSQPRILLVSAYADGIHVHTNSSGGGQIPGIIGVKIMGEDLIGSHPLLDPEWVIKQNPEVILLLDIPDSISKGYDTNDASGMAAYRDEFMNDSKFSKLDAVINGRVYLLDGKSMTYSGSYILCIVYMAKLFYPELFKDFDPRAVHQEYLKLQGLDYNLNENGVFLYPPIRN